jgi:hypothetical protein
MDEQQHIVLPLIRQKVSIGFGRSRFEYQMKIVLSMRYNYSQFDSEPKRSESSSVGRCTQKPSASDVDLNGYAAQIPFAPPFEQMEL